MSVKARDALVVNLANLFDEFTDLNYAYRFGPPKYDVIAVTLKDESGAVRSDDVSTARSARPGRSRVTSASAPSSSARATRRSCASRRAASRSGSRSTHPATGPRTRGSTCPRALNGSSPCSTATPSRPPRGRVRALNSTVAAVIRSEEES